MNRRAFQQLLFAAGVTYGTRSALATPTQSSSAPDPSSAAPFHFSIMLWTITKMLPFDRCLEIAAEAGYNGVELVGESLKWSPAETTRILAKLQTLGLVVDATSGVKTGFADPASSSAFLAELATMITAAKTLHCPQVILLSGPRVPNLPLAAQHAACVENLKRAAELAARQNIQLLIEPIDVLENPTIYLTSVTEGFKIVQEVGSEHVRVLYDFYHEQRGAGNLLEKLEQNIDLVGLVHIADVPGRHEPGTGEIDYRNIYRKLAALKYNKFVAMEYYPTGDPLASLRKQRLAAIAATQSTSA